MPAIAIVQHRRVDEDSRLLDLLRAHTSMPVVEPEDKTPIERGTVYLAPSDYHLLVEDRHFALSTDAPVLHARPSIDVLFESAADAYGPRLLAIVLTCASDDGVAGALAVRARGGRVVVQDPTGATSPILPRAVIARGAADRILPLDEIAAWVATACGCRPVTAQ